MRERGGGGGGEVERDGGGDQIGMSVCDFPGGNIAIIDSSLEKNSS